MTFQHRKSVTHRLAMAAKAHRARSGAHLSRIGLHAGQEAVLKALADEDGRTMSQLAQVLGVQPPTVTKMVSRLSAQNLLKRVPSETDGRLARVHLTDEGKAKIDEIDRIWKRIEREALAGFDDKDRKKLRKLLRTIERNLTLQLDAPDEVEVVEEPEDDPEE
jgi:DNA-binding MarR family transcriptional regulator